MTSKKLVDFKQRFESELQESGKMSLFEMEVINSETKEKDYITFDIFVLNSFFVAQHEPLTVKEQKSKKIACKRIKIDPDFSVTENLQELYEECYTAIIESELFELSENT